MSARHRQQPTLPCHDAYCPAGSRRVLTGFHLEAEEAEEGEEEDEEEGDGEEEEEVVLSMAAIHVV